MDILDILLDILLKPPQPFIGLFFNIIIRISTNFLMLSVKEHLHSELDGQPVFHNFGTEATQIWNTWLSAENSTQQGEVEVFMF